MPGQPSPITFATLHESPLIRVEDYICRTVQGGPGEEERHSANTIVLMRHGVFCKHFGRQSVTADVNHAIFFSKGSTVKVSHPADCGDRGTVFTLAPRVLRDIVRELDPTVDDHPDRPFPFVTGPCDSSAFWRHRELVQRIAAQDLQPLEHLWADVTALQLSADILEAAFRQAGVTRKPRRAATDREHADRAEAAKTFLASSLGRRVTLDDVAKAVHTSPFHFTRIFQQRVGVPVHRYLTQLRLRAALERLAEGEDDLTTLALDLGFSSHSHFADAFRKEFGRTPSEVRRSAPGRALRQMSKNPEV
ncbi:MAG: AraC family transcriptional regulator [Vicinamibacteria bacterium]|nr:AraC family transcriptional regulator [Vicinamibacteria bacterium]